MVAPVGLGSLFGSLGSLYGNALDHRQQAAQAQANYLSGLQQAASPLPSAAYQMAQADLHRYLYQQFGGPPPLPPEPLPFFMDPEQIEALTPGVDWSARVGDRIRGFIALGALSKGTSRSG